MAVADGGAGGNVTDGDDGGRKGEGLAQTMVVGGDPVEAGADPAQVEAGGGLGDRGGGGSEVADARSEADRSDDGLRFPERGGGGNGRRMPRLSPSREVRHEPRDDDVAPSFCSAGGCGEGEPVLARCAIPRHARVDVQVDVRRPAGVAAGSGDGGEVVGARDREVDARPNRRLEVGTGAAEPREYRDS